MENLRRLRCGRRARQKDETRHRARVKKIKKGLNHPHTLPSPRLSPPPPPPPPTKITSTSFFEGMNDAQLEAYFLGGSAVVPSQEPPYNATGTPTWDLCAGEPLINAFTANSSIAKANWPAGLQRA